MSERRSSGRGWALWLVLLGSGAAARAEPLPPPGWRAPPAWQVRCVERVEQTRRRLGKTHDAFRAARPVTLLPLEEGTHEAWLRVDFDSQLTLHLSFRTGEQPPSDASEGSGWIDRLLDVKQPQRLLLRQVVRGQRGLQTELALHPEIPHAASLVRALRRAVDACVRELDAQR